APILLAWVVVREIVFFTPCLIQNGVLEAVQEIGSLTGDVEKQFDTNDEINNVEAAKILPKARNLLAVVKKFVLRLGETRARN
ncbi:hypothetical protein ACNO6Z_12040, partial [Aliarcobacter lanthieri]|uniref:hypothetical protein n=1 Tax=Aliarcobacter lanthieri TaxID=1355374 RepID=UPI003AA82C3B